MRGAVNGLKSRKCRKLFQSSKRVVCVKLSESAFGVVVELKVLKVGKCTFNSKTSLKQVWNNSFGPKQLFQSCFRLVFELKVQTAMLHKLQPSHNSTQTTLFELKNNFLQFLENNSFTAQGITQQVRRHGGGRERCLAYLCSLTIPSTNGRVLL